MFNIVPPKFVHYYDSLKEQSFNFLDVGAGSHSPTITKQFFPKVKYFGIDRTNYCNDEADVQAMTEYYEMDLTDLAFERIPDSHFDVINMSHVIEHLADGDQVIEGLIPKLKHGGYIYIEYPGMRSTKLPSMKGTLNFYDDETHVRLFSIPEVSSILASNGCTVLKSGTRRHWPYILAFPYALVKQTLIHGYVPGVVFWDILGFAEYVFARRT